MLSDRAERLLNDLKPYIEGPRSRPLEELAEDMIISCLKIRFDFPQVERNKIETILDELRAAEREQKHTLIEKGKQWISKNKDLLGDVASIVLKALSGQVGS